MYLSIIFFDSTIVFLVSSDTTWCRAFSDCQRVVTERIGGKSGCHLPTSSAHSGSEPHKGFESVAQNSRRHGVAVGVAQCHPASDIAGQH